MRKHLKFLVAILIFWSSPALANEQELTALAAARLVVNETAFGRQCVPWEVRPGCINDLGGILQRTEHMAARRDRSMFEEIRRHSPRGTGRCYELAQLLVPFTEWPRRCLARVGGNTRWAPHLRADLEASQQWLDVYPNLPWRNFRPKWERTLNDARRWFADPWYPCGTRCVEQPGRARRCGAPARAQIEAWAGRGDTLNPGLAPVACGPSRNRFCERVRGTGARQDILTSDREEGTIPACVGRGDPS